jgi:hypothetical protein
MRRDNLVGRFLSLLLAAVMVLIGCRSDEQAGNQETLERYTIELEPSGGSGVSGTATFRKITGGIEVELDVRGLPRSETVYLAHIHRGTCAEAVREEGETDTGDHAHDGAEDIEQPLSPVRSNPEGRGSSTTLLRDSTLDGEFSGTPKYVNVHAAGQGYPPPLACGDL